MADLLKKWNEADRDEWASDMGLPPDTAELESVEDMIDGGWTDVETGTKAWLHSLGLEASR